MRIELTLAHRQAGHHASQRTAQRPRQSGHRTATGRRRRSRHFVDKVVRLALHQRPRDRRHAEYFLVHIERRYIPKAHRLNRHLHQVGHGEARRLPHFPQVVARRLAHRRIRHDTDHLRTGDDHAALARLLPGRLQHFVWRTHYVVGEVHTDLGPLVVIDHPADRLHLLKTPVRKHRPAGGRGIDAQVLVPLPQIAAVLFTIVVGQLVE